MDPGPGRPAGRAAPLGSGSAPARRPLHVDDAVAARSGSLRVTWVTPATFLLSALAAAAAAIVLAVCAVAFAGGGGWAPLAGMVVCAALAAGSSRSPWWALPATAELIATAGMANRLASASSPYLRQHAGNRSIVSLGEEAMRAARETDRPILLSVGYSACHWCHVMAHECFEDAGIAALMNELFVSVKVDREERPDVDAVYMEAVQVMTGQGGWPMTVFLTPAGAPFFAGPTSLPCRVRHARIPAVLRAAAALPPGPRGRRADRGRDRAALAPPPLPAGRSPPPRSSPGRWRGSWSRSTRGTAVSVVLPSSPSRRSGDAPSRGFAGSDGAAATAARTTSTGCFGRHL